MNFVIFHQFASSDRLCNQRFDFVDLIRRWFVEGKVSNEPNGYAFIVKRKFVETAFVVPPSQFICFSIAADEKVERNVR